VSRERSERIEAIGSQLPALGLDVAAFQEVWTADARRSLVEAGRRAGLVHAWHRRASLGGSGLVVLSRAAIAESRFEAFALRGFPHRVWHGDYHGGKGFCVLRFASAQGAFTLIDTHLHAQYTDDAHDDVHAHRVGQVVQLAAAIAALPGPVIATGDFNMREGRPEYAVFTGLTGMRDAAVELSRREFTTLASNPYRIARDATLEERIDYVFTRDGDGERVRARSLERIFDRPPGVGPAAYSDHAGLLAELAFESDPASRTPVPAAAAAALAAQVLDAGRAAARARRVERRLVAAGALTGAGLAVAGRRRRPLSRRSVLRAGLGAGALLALPFGITNAMLSELAVPDEVNAYALVEARLAGLRARTS
jgi:endonuclease/exonuclease/phosphatase family metal-dependent hydrolase